MGQKPGALSTLNRWLMDGYSLEISCVYIYIYIYMCIYIYIHLYHVKKKKYIYHIYI